MAPSNEPSHDTSEPAAEDGGRASGGLHATTPLELGPIEGFSQLLEGMRETSFGARALGEALDVMRAMRDESGCAIVGTFTGAMTMAKMGPLIRAMIEEELLHAVVTTGALVTHSLSESLGKPHYRAPADMDDVQLYGERLNRVLDTLEPEDNLNHVGNLIQDVLNEMGDISTWSSADLCRKIGGVLDERGHASSFLAAAYRRGVPVHVPAFTDSQLGIDVAVWTMRQALPEQWVGGSEEAESAFSALPSFNPFKDLSEFSRWALARPSLGIFTVGGGVPRNWAQQVGPYLDYLYKKIGLGKELLRFKYGVRICPEPAHWGGLSGCTYSEGVTWGKFIPVSEGGRFAEVYCDATIAWPILLKALLEDTSS